MFDSKKILYTGAFRFPDQDAAAFRVFSIAELCKTSGWGVVFAGWEQAKEGITRYNYCGYDCFPQGEFRSKPINILGRLFGFLFRGHKTLRWMWRNRDTFNAVIAYNPPALFSLLLLVMGKLVGFKVVLDSTEWYESAHLPGGVYGLASLENWIRMNLVYKLFNHVICISSFLERHFQNKNVIKIPPLLPRNNLGISIKPDVRAGISLIYAGEAGKKDRLLRLIKSLPSVQKKVCVKIEFHIVGMDWRELSEELIGNSLDSDSLGSFIICHGRVPRADVLRLYGSCHFSVFFREKRRYALAGFPTKVMESLASACPVITNAVGDLSEVLKNNVNAFILEESQLEVQLPIFFEQALLGNSYDLMAESARNTADDYFSIGKYKESFLIFSNELFELARKS